MAYRLTTRGFGALLGELPAAHVDRVDLERAVLEQAVGEAARRGANVQPGLACDVYAERCEGILPLRASARDVTRQLTQEAAHREGAFDLSLPLEADASAAQTKRPL